MTLTLPYCSASDFIVTDDLEIQDATPHLRFTDTTASEDDFEWYADNNQAYFTNVTDAVILLRFDSTNTNAEIAGTNLNALRDRTIGSFCGGNLYTAMNCEEARVYVPWACTPQQVVLASTTAPTGAAIIVDVNECSAPGTCTTLFSTQANRPQIAISALSGSTITFNDTTIAAGNYVGVDLDQVGSTVAGSNLTMTLVCRVQ